MRHSAVGGGMSRLGADGLLLVTAVLWGVTFVAQKYATATMPALDRLKLYKLVWDLIGSEFAGRHLQYEKFYAGASFIVRNHSFREAPWQDFHRLVEDLMASLSR